MELTKEILAQLSEPFPADVIDFKPGATSQDKSRALALAYVEVRHYIDRLNEIVADDWSDVFDFISASGELVRCSLTVCGVTRQDIGEKDSKDVNTATSAVAQAFKRACVKFGLGRHLYAIERVWVAYDAQRKQFTPQAYEQLRRLVSGEVPQAAQEPPKPSRQQPAKQTNGNGMIDFPTAPPAEFLKYINDQVQVPYDGLDHLANALRQEGLPVKSWPNAKRNPDWWLKAKALAIQHAQAKAA